MLNEDGVSNVVALSFAGLLFTGLIALMVLQTVDVEQVEIPGDHEAMADQLYDQPVYAETVPCSVEFNGCLSQLGFLDNAGLLDGSVIQGILDGVQTADATTISEGEMVELVDGWFSISPLSVTRNIEIIVIESATNCSAGSYASPWSQYDDADVDCMKVVPGNPPCDKNNPPAVCLGDSLADKNPDVVVVNEIDNWDFDAVQDWFDGNPQGLLIMANVNEASDLDVASAYLAGAVPSYLGGLYDLSYPDVVDVQSGTTGDAPVSDEDIWHVEGAIAATRPGALTHQVIITSQPLTAPVFENLLARGEGFWLEYGERDDFNSAKRVVSDGTTLHMLQAWSAPRTA